MINFSKNKILILLILVLILLAIAGGVCWYNQTMQSKSMQPQLTPESPEKIIIQKFIQENLKENYYPEPLEVKHKLTIHNQSNGSSDVYGAFWEMDNTKFYSFIDYNPDMVGITHLGISIQPSDIPEKIDEETARAITGNYFKDIKGELNCREALNELTDQTFTICESFWQEENGIKRGVGMLMGFVFACQIPPESEHYQWQSCTQW